MNRSMQSKDSWKAQRLDTGTDAVISTIDHLSLCAESGNAQGSKGSWMANTNSPALSLQDRICASPFLPSFLLLVAVKQKISNSSYTLSHTLKSSNPLPNIHSSAVQLLLSTFTGTSNEIFTAMILSALACQLH